MNDEEYLEKRLKKAEEILTNTNMLIKKYPKDNGLKIDKIIFENQVKELKEKLNKE